MSYKVRIESFEGPFDLLLYLVSRQKVDIGSISITEIIDQYLAEVQRMESIDLDVASEFLLVASTLLKIKAESLVQRPQADLDEDVAYLAPDEARDILVQKLVDYKQYKNVAKYLEQAYSTESCRHIRPFGPGKPFVDVRPDFLRGMTVGDIATVAAACYARKERFLLDSDHIALKPIPVETYVKAIFARVQNKGTVNFSQLIRPDDSAPVVVVSFLAILELYKRSMVRLEQAAVFGDIQITYIEGSDIQTLPPDTSEKEE